MVSNVLPLKKKHLKSEFNGSEDGSNYGITQATRSRKTGSMKTGTTGIRSKRSKQKKALSKSDLQSFFKYVKEKDGNELHTEGSEKGGYKLNKSATLDIKEASRSSTVDRSYWTKKR